MSLRCKHVIICKSYPLIAQLQTTPQHYFLDTKNRNTEFSNYVTYLVLRDAVVLRRDDMPGNFDPSAVSLMIVGKAHIDKIQLPPQDEMPFSIICIVSACTSYQNLQQVRILVWMILCASQQMRCVSRTDKDIIPATLK